MAQTMKLTQGRPRAFAIHVLGGRSGWAVLASLFLLLGFARPALGATFEPTRFDDPVPNGCRVSNCSLREAVIAANKRVGRDTLQLSRGTYRLTREETADPITDRFGDLDLVDEARIVGAGSRKTVLDGDDASDIGGVLDLKGIVETYTVRDLTVRDGAATGHPGGGIHAGNLAGSLTLARARVLSSYSSKTGGGIFSVADELTIKKSTIAGNRADSEGGGIYLQAVGGSGGTNTAVISSTVSGNRATGNGGGLSANGANVGSGPQPPEVTAQNSTFAANETSGSGGGIWAVQGATVSLDNVTVAHNDAETDGAGGGLGGGIGRAASAGPFTVGDVLLAGNAVGASGNGSQCAGAFTGQNGNVVQLQSGTACAITGSITEPVDAPIGPLAENGGPTKTVALLDGSAPIGFAESCPPKDQREFPRPAADCDSGAFEHQGP